MPEPARSEFPMYALIRAGRRCCCCIFPLVHASHNSAAQSDMSGARKTYGRRRQTPALNASLSILMAGHSDAHKRCMRESVRCGRQSVADSLLERQGAPRFTPSMCATQMLLFRGCKSSTISPDPYSRFAFAGVGFSGGATMDYL